MNVTLTVEIKLTWSRSAESGVILMLYFVELQKNLNQKSAKRREERRTRQRKNNKNGAEVVSSELPRKESDGGSGDSPESPLRQPLIPDVMADKDVKDVSRQKVLMVETENYKVHEYTKDDMMKVRDITCTDFYSSSLFAFEFKRILF